MTIDTQILQALRSTASISGAQLAETLGISRAAVWSRIEDLRKLGYEIHVSPHEGYQLRSAPDRLVADDIAALLGGRPVIGRDIRVFQETTSTNDVVEKLGRDGVKEGVVVFAESQTKGRGRLGRSWISRARKGLWFSVLLRPDIAPAAATRITVASATALARALRSVTQLPCEIKWPNDILVRDRKLCGILTEMNAEIEKIHYIVLGIGVNVNFEAADFPAELRPTATSLKIETQRGWSRAELAAEILRELEISCRKVAASQFGKLAEEWEALCSTLGRNVEIMSGGRTVLGRAESLDDEGALLVRTQHGRLERIVGGDVTLKK